MFVATWKHGPEAQLDSTQWIDALQEALKISAEDPFRDELLSIEWRTNE